MKGLKKMGNKLRPCFCPITLGICLGTSLLILVVTFLVCLMSYYLFFSSISMYNSTKMQVSDSREYQDFLQMYSGKAKTCDYTYNNDYTSCLTHKCICSHIAYYYYCWWCWHWCCCCYILTHFKGGIHLFCASLLLITIGSAVSN